MDASERLKILDVINSTEFDDPKFDRDVDGLQGTLQAGGSLHLHFRAELYFSTESCYEIDDDEMELCIWLMATPDAPIFLIETGGRLINCDTIDVDCHGMYNRPNTNRPT